MNEPIKQEIKITDRRAIEISGVRAILEFDDRFMKLDTALGTVVIEGIELKIEDMSKDSGRIFAKGELVQLAFVEDGKKRGKGSFFK